MGACSAGHLKETCAHTAAGHNRTLKENTCMHTPSILTVRDKQSLHPRPVPPLQGPRRGGGGGGGGGGEE